MYNDKKIVEQITPIVKKVLECRSSQKRELLIQLGELVEPFSTYIVKRMAKEYNRRYFFELEGLMFEISPKYKKLRLYVDEEVKYQRCLTFAYGTVNKELYQKFEDELNKRV